MSFFEDVSAEAERQRPGFKCHAVQIDVGSTEVVLLHAILDDGRYVYWRFDAAPGSDPGAKALEVKVGVRDWLRQYDEETQVAV